MKKRLLFVAAIFAATATFAQDGLTSKKGEAYLPEAGDWALGFDGTSFVNYIGNMANGTNGTNSISFTNGGAIYGKMFKDEKTAYRVMFQLGFNSATETQLSDSMNTATGTMAFGAISDERKISGNQIGLGFGLEKRRGNTRIQGVYGAMLTLGFGGGSTAYTYGDTHNDGHTVTWYDWNAGSSTTSNGSRTTESKNGSTFNLGIVGFVGFEWFFAPKFSLGAEYRWGLDMQSTGEGETTSQRWGLASATATANSLITETRKTGKASSFNFGPMNNGSGVLMVNFHF